MSTKTTFKRIALVTVAALGFGMLSVAPSSAYDIQGAFRTLSVSTPNSTATTNVAATTVLTGRGSCGLQGSDSGAANVFVTATTQIDVAPIGSNLATNSVTVVANTAAGSNGAPTGYTNTNATSSLWPSDSNNGYRNSAHFACTDASSALTGHVTVKFTPDVAGTYVIVMTPLGASTGSVTWTVVATSPVYNHSTVAVTATGNGTPASSVTDGVLGAQGTASVDAMGLVTVSQYSSADESIASTTAIAQPITVSISKGAVSNNSGTYFTAAPSATVTAPTTGTHTFKIWSNGGVGTATLTVSVGSSVVATKTVIFKGAAVALAVSADKLTIGPSGSGRSTAVLTVTAKDSAGNSATSVPAYTCTSGTAATATVSGSVVSGLAVGSTVITCASNDSSATSATVTINVAPDVSTTATTLTFDKDSYSPGELMTITVGAAANDYGYYYAFTDTPIASQNLVSISGTPWYGQVALVNGSATWKAYAPLASGPLTITATSTTGTSTAVVATTTVVADTTAADAAAEATDAANAATDAANAAAEAADAATAAAQDAADAVAALSAQVADLIAGLKAQLTALTNLVIKIQKKVKA